jgi:hypothetical protein
VPEWTCRDPLVEILMRALFGFSTFNSQSVLLCGDGDLFGCEASQRQGDLIVVLTGPFDVVGRIIVAVRPSNGILDEVEEVIESNCRSPKGSKIKVVLATSSFRATWLRALRTPCPAPK